MLELLITFLGPPLLVVACATPWAMRSLRQGSLEVWRRALGVGAVGGYVLTVLVGAVQDQIFANAHDGRSPMISSFAVAMIVGALTSVLGAALGSLGTLAYARRRERMVSPDGIAR